MIAARLEVVTCAADFARPVEAMLVAPWLAGVLGDTFSAHLPFWMCAAMVLFGAGVLAATCRYLAHIDDPEDQLAELTDEATAVTLSNES
jgi:ACDE family multidrug resistance protein